MTVNSISDYATKQANYINALAVYMSSIFKQAGPTYHKSDGYYYLSTNGNVQNFQKGLICSHHHHERQTVAFSSRTHMEKHVEKMVKQFAMMNSSPSMEEKGVDTSSTEAQQLVDYIMTNTDTNAVIVIHDPS
jgi:hypothetical protein